MKSEPSDYSIDDFFDSPGKKTDWTGIRNYQARNFMRDQMQVGDQAFFYHSSCPEPGIVGLIEVCSKPYPDPTQFDPSNHYYDEKSSRENPRWVMVDVKLKKKTRLLSLSEMREHEALAAMVVLRKGNRLSITPVENCHWQAVLKLL